MYTDDGPQSGPFAEWFESVYSELAAKPKYAALGLKPAADVHGGYFSKDKATKNKPERFKDTRGNTKADEDTYELIMRDKERLLDPDVPLRSSSATRPCGRGGTIPTSSRSAPSTSRDRPIASVRRSDAGCDSR